MRVATHLLTPGLEEPHELYNAVMLRAEGAGEIIDIRAERQRRIAEALRVEVKNVLADQPKSDTHRRVA